MSDLKVDLKINISKVLFKCACVDSDNDEEIFDEKFDDYCNYIADECKKKKNNVLTSVSLSYDDNLSDNIYFSAEGNISSDKEAYIEMVFKEEYENKSLVLGFWEWHALQEFDGVEK